MVSTSVVPVQKLLDARAGALRNMDEDATMLVGNALLASLVSSS